MSTYCAEVRPPDHGTQPQPAASPGEPRVKLLLITQRPDGFFLERFTERGELVGATQHEEMDEAQRTAYADYGPISDWRLCPDGVDPLEYLRA